MGVLERWSVFAKGIVFIPGIWKSSRKTRLEEVKMKGSVTSVENLGFFFPAFQNMLKGETRYL